MGSVFRSAFRFLASNGLAVVLLLLLMLLTFLGTLQQVNEGLYQVQERYFGSLYVVHWVGGAIPVPLPGAYLLMVLAFVNLGCGGVIRVRKGWRHIGILIAHVGILLLLAGSFFAYHYAVRGHVTLYEGEQSDRFQSYEDWELVVTGPSQTGEMGSLIIPGTEFQRMTGNRSRTFYSASLPFEIDLSGYAANATVTPAAQDQPGEAKAVDGSCLKILPPAMEAEQNMPGAYVAVKEKASGTQHEHILSAAKDPVSFAVDNKTWTIALEHRSWPLPFTIMLDKFTRELHPGTSIPKVFMSEVTKMEGDSRQRIQISMNEPLRHKGYTLYQASWGPSNAGPHDRLFSTFAVVKNPAESLPLYSCSIIGLGLLIHFALKLFAYLRQQSKLQQQSKTRS